jgi:hypothetical protein
MLEPAREASNAESHRDDRADKPTWAAAQAKID